MSRGAGYAVRGAGLPASSGRGAGRAAAAAAPPSITYSTADETWYDYFTSVNIAAPSNAGGAITSFAVTAGALPAGVSLNASTGAITGTPTALKTDAVVTITATGPGGTDTFDITIEVLSMLLWPQNNGGPTLVVGYDTAVGFSSLKSASDGSGGEAADTEPVGWMTDLSGNGDEAIQATSGNKPTVSATGENGKRCIAFGGDDFLALSAFTGGAETQPNTVGCVGRLGAAGGGAQAAFIDGASGAFAIVFGDTTNTWAMYAGTATVDSGDATDTNTHFHLVAPFNGASSKQYLDGTEIGAGNPGANDMNGVTLGCTSASTAPLPSGSRLSAAFVYNGTLDATAIANLKTWSVNKWGTPA